MLRISDEATVRWEVAIINKPDPNRTDGQIGYGVDAGTGCFMDLDAAQTLEHLFPNEDKFNKFCDQVIAQMKNNSFGKCLLTAGWANI